jgi:N-acetylglucosamine-6-phosphate deacetylase
MSSKKDLFPVHDLSIINRIISEMKIIDIHTHGIGGYDTRTTAVEHILKIAEIQGSYGVSEILLTVYPSSVQEMRGHMDTIRKAIQIQQSSLRNHQISFENQTTSNNSPPTVIPSENFRCAIISGINLEGPFLNPARSGSLHAEACIRPAEDVVKDLTEGFEDIIRIITVAPEMPDAQSIIRKLSDTGIIVSMGHSDATYAEAEAGYHAGAKGITHLFNAMRSFHHREPGIAGFGLSNQDIYIEIIADPFHLDARVIELIFRIKNPDKIIIISDTVRETNREFSFSGIRDDSSRLLGGSMAVAESAERLIRLGYDRDAIMRCITENPERYLSHPS